MPTSVGPNTFGEENLVFGYDTGDTANSFPGIPAVNCSGVPSSRGNWSVTEITDGSIVPPRKGARVFKFVTGTASNLFRQSGYYGGGGFSNNNNVNPLILGRTSPSNFTTVSQANKYRYGFWVRGVESNNAGWSFYIDIGDLGGAASKSYTVGNNTDWYFIDVLGQGTNSNGYPYDFFDLFSSNQGLTMYVSDMGIMRSPGTVDDLPIIQAYPQWVDYGQERTYTEGLKDLTGNSTIDLTNVSFDSNAQIEFDGSDDTASVNSYSAIELVDNVSIEYVYKRLSTDPILDVIANKYHSTGWELFCTAGNKFRLAGRNGDGTYYSTTNGAYTIENNKYYHLIAIKEGLSWRLYVNGELYSFLTANTVGTWSNTGILQIGGEGNGYYPNMKLPVFKIYNRVLTASEIKANYNAIKGRFNI